MSTNLQGATAMRSVHASLLGRSGQFSFRLPFSLLPLLVLLFVASSGVFGQTTYTWNLVGGGNWTIATNWTPTRTTPAATDIMVISNAATIIITNVPTQTIGRLSVENTTNVTLSAGGGAQTLTIGDGVADATNDLSIAATSSLTIASNLENIVPAANALGDISGTLTLNRPLNLNNAGIVVTVSNGGILGVTSNNGAVTNSTTAKLIFNSGAIYQHGRNGGAVPVATWDANSNCNLTGLTNGYPTGMDQTFGNVSITKNGGSLTMSTDLTCLGDFTHTNTGAGIFNTAGAMSRAISIGGDFNNVSGHFRLVSGTGSSTMTVGGNFNLSGGLFTGKAGSGTAILDIAGNYIQTGGTFDQRAANATNTAVVTVDGNFSLSGGTYDLCGVNGATTVGTLNVAGDFMLSGGDLTETATTTGRGEVFFNGSGVQTYSNMGGTVSNTVNFTVNSGATLQMEDENTIVAGGGTFTLSSGATLGITAPDGIATVGAMGNIQVTGTRTYSAAANYLYNGTMSQTPGDGFPATLTGGLEIDNPAGLSLTAPQVINFPGTLTLTDGNLNTDDTNLLTLGEDVVIVPMEGSAASFVDGPILKYGADNFIFPIGQDTTWAPLGISNVMLANPASEGFTARYQAAPLNPDSLAPMLTRVSAVEHWDLNPTNVGASVDLTLYWNSVTSGISDPTDGLTIAHFNTTTMMWEDIPVLSASGTAASGSVTAGPVSSFSPFSFGLVNPSDPMANPLPIELHSFTATPKSKTVQLDWRTASELNNAFFEIERSANGRDFENIGKVAGAGTSQTPLDYEFTDLLPLNGWNYYRLRQVDFDGEFSYSPIQAVLMGKAGEVRLLVFPNPTNNELNLKTDHLLQAGDRIEIYDYTGRQVLHVSASDAINAPITVSQLPAGTYIVRLRTADGTVSTSFVKQ